MCGICGILHRDPQQPVSTALLRAMTDTLAHRGPDGSGHWHRGPVGLGHRRLAITDLRPIASQPLANEDETVWLTFNGAIANHPELRRELTARGHRFRTESDTEVIVHLWEEYSYGCVDRLRGMFAFAIWDDRRRILFLARDRLGKKPLFYAALPDRFLFASEPKAILQDPALVPRPDLVAIHHYLAYQSVPAPWSAFRGLRKLPAAHTLTIGAGAEHPLRYWRVPTGQSDVLAGIPAGPDPAGETATDPGPADPGNPDPAGLVSDLRHRLREAVRLRLRADVPVGVLLSGGLDSSLIAAIARQETGGALATFSMGFGEAEYDERSSAGLVAKHLGTDHHEAVTAAEVGRRLPRLAWHYGEPFADSSAVATWELCALARTRVKVVLTGDGGDENFAGYPRYQNQGMHALRSDYPGTWQRLLQRGTDVLRAFVSPGMRWWRSWRRLVGLRQDRLLYYYRLTHFHEGYQAQLYHPEFRRSLDDIYTVDLLLQKYRQVGGQDFVDATTKVDLDLYLPDTLMTKTDIAGMGHGLEARMPLLDHPFVEWAGRLPSSWKLHRGTTAKYLLKEAARGLLPDAIIDRPKMGFGVPIDHWLRGPWRNLAHDLLLSRRATGRGYFRREYVEDLLRRHQQGESWQYLLWNLLMLELWHLLFIDRTLDPTTMLPVEISSPRVARPVERR